MMGLVLEVVSCFFVCERMHKLAMTGVFLIHWRGA